MAYKDLEKKKAYNKKFKESEWYKSYQKEYREKNREKQRRLSKEWYIKNKEKHNRRVSERIMSKKHMPEEIEKRKARQSRWYWERGGKEKIALQNKKRAPKIKKYREKYVANNKRVIEDKRKEKVISLSDSYIRERIRYHLGIKGSQVTPTLIQQYRQLVISFREKRNKSKGLSVKELSANSRKEFSDSYVVDLIVGNSGIDKKQIYENREFIETYRTNVKLKRLLNDRRKGKQAFGEDGGKVIPD